MFCQLYSQADDEAGYLLPNSIASFSTTFLGGPNSEEAP